MPPIADLLEYRPLDGLFRWKVMCRNGQCTEGWFPGYWDGRYFSIMVGGRRYRAHRLAWFLTHGEFPTGVIDHINRNSLDNRLANLRDVSHSENIRNSPLRTDNTSGFKGISWMPKHRKFQVYLNIKGTRRPLGYRGTLTEAIILRDVNALCFGMIIDDRGPHATS